MYFNLFETNYIRFLYIISFFIGFLTKFRHFVRQIIFKFLNLSYFNNNPTLCYSFTIIEKTIGHLHRKTMIPYLYDWCSSSFWTKLTNKVYLSWPIFILWYFPRQELWWNPYNFSLFYVVLHILVSSSIKNKSL